VPATPLDARERAQLCLRFDEFGPDAPTLCEGWTTFDLAAHLVIRERNPLAGPGIVVPQLAAVADRFMAREKRRGYAAVVDRVRTGPPPGPFAVPGLREQLNLVEYAVHHEDVRRANAMPTRTHIDDLQDALWSKVRRLARFAIRGVPKGVGIHLVRTNPDGTATGDVAHARHGDRVATVTGESLEVLLWAYGRGDHAAVKLSGEVEALANARFGI
jgi:uncharacterized protein (TIGR03085 family)